MALRVAQAVEHLEATLVGGQAVNFWAEMYSEDVPELGAFGPFTSKDVDFFGPRRAAADLAAALGGVATYPTLDTCNTPNSAIVAANVDGHEVRIDFLTHVLGTGREGVVAATLEVTLESGTGGDPQQFTLRIMHPFLCLTSRINTILHPAIGRTDDFALRQVEAAYLILRKYISDMLDMRQVRDACLCFDRLQNFLLRDPYGRIAHKRTTVDPLDIVRHFVTDQRLDARYLDLILAKVIRRVEGRRMAWDRLSRQAGKTP